MEKILELHTVKYENDQMYILDTSKLPSSLEYVKMNNVEDCFDAIKTLKVRGAPAIGVAAAYALVLSSKAARKTSFGEFYEDFKKDKDYLAKSRPTAVNLFWALDRIDAKVIENKDRPIDEICKVIKDEADLIKQEDIMMCRQIGEHGLTLLKDGMGILTHCNTGVLAASKYGTALAPIYLAKERGMNIKVYADETRPLLQGARLTAYELHHSGVDVTLICDNMAATVMKNGWVQAVFLGCDRIAANGDVANKIGTYSVAVLARYHNIPFYVIGPTSTIDMSIPDGSAIPIEERDKKEIIFGLGYQIAPEGVNVYNPAFDVTPNELITGIITEKGIVRPPFKENLKKLFT
ncbi:MAG TPA: S-methyl-5-thioribose-1-phosphate isomerase [Clostridiaceae bacterium]|nr:S-methyl-5-thioribose-1-phosphate isomerase [Clostridiaceae bacterium]